MLAGQLREALRSRDVASEGMFDARVRVPSEAAGLGRTGRVGVRRGWRGWLAGAVGVCREGKAGSWDADRKGEALPAGAEAATAEGAGRAGGDSGAGAAGAAAELATDRGELWVGEGLSPRRFSLTSSLLQARNKHNPYQSVCAAGQC